MDGFARARSRRARLTAGAAIAIVASICLAAAAHAATLAVTKNNDYMGTITSSPAGINCGTDCSSDSANFASGTDVTLTASGASHYLFDEWAGDCSGGANTCTVTMDANRWAHAKFACIPTSSYDRPYTPFTADTYVSDGSPSQNLGSNQHVRVGYGSTGSRWYTYVKGPLPPVPRGCTPTGAELVLPNVDFGPVGGVTLWIKPVAANWDEMSITWNNRPFGTGTGFNHIGNYEGECCAGIIDIRDIGPMYDGSSPNYGFLVRPSGSCGALWPDQTCSPSQYNDVLPGASITSSSREGAGAGGIVVGWQ